MTTDGVCQEMPEELHTILNAEDWESCSYNTKNGKLGLILTTKAEEKLKRILRLELNDVGKITTMREL